MIELHVYGAILISKDPYGTDVMSAFELAKGYTKPLAKDSINMVPDDIGDDYEKLQSKRKLGLIMKSKATEEASVSFGDMIEVYQKDNLGKNGTWSSPKIVLTVDNDARNVTIPSKGRKRTTVAFEDIRLALPEDSLAKAIESAIDELNHSIDESIAWYENIYIYI